MNSLFCSFINGTVDKFLKSGFVKKPDCFRMDKVCSLFEKSKRS